jgi:hypothetical protein
VPCDSVEQVCRALGDSYHPIMDALLATARRPAFGRGLTLWKRIHNIYQRLVSQPSLKRKLTEVFSAWLGALLPIRRNSCQISTN